MGWFGASFPEMPDTPFDPLDVDPSTTDRLLAGLDPDDAPSAYAGVAQLLAAVTAPADPAELRGEAAAVVAFTAAGYGIEASPTAPNPSCPNPSCPNPSCPNPSWRIRMLSNARSAKLAAAGVVAGLTLTSGLAAAGALPGPAQSAASRTLSHIGISVPGPDDHANARAQEVNDPDGTTSTTSSTSTTSTTSTSTSTRLTTEKPEVEQEHDQNQGPGSVNQGPGNAVEDQHENEHAAEHENEGAGEHASTTSTTEVEHQNGDSGGDHHGDSGESGGSNSSAGSVSGKSGGGD